MKSKQQLELPDDRECKSIFTIMEKDPEAQPKMDGMSEYKGHDARHGSKHKGKTTSSREARYKGHTIQIRTTYEIKIDGKEYNGHIRVDDQGHVHSHSIPYMNYGSTMEFVKCLIDLHPDTFNTKEEAK